MSIVLIGMMGSGKSTIGKLLVKELGYKLLDADSMIESMEGMTINEIFQVHGESFFRSLETSLLESLGEYKEKIILSTGGGMVVREENRPLLKSLGTVVYLDGSAETLIERLTGESDGRPLLKEGVEKKVKDLLSKREDIYKTCAHVVIDINGVSTDAIIDEILSKVSIQTT